MKTALTLFGDSVSLEEAILGFDWSATPLGTRRIGHNRSARSSR